MHRLKLRNLSAQLYRCHRRKLSIIHTAIATVLRFIRNLRINEISNQSYVVAAYISTRILDEGKIRDYTSKAARRVFPKLHPVRRKVNRRRSTRLRMYL